MKFFDTDEYLYTTQYIKRGSEYFLKMQTVVSDLRHGEPVHGRFSRLLSVGTFGMAEDVFSNHLVGTTSHKK